MSKTLKFRLLAMLIALAAVVGAYHHTTEQAMTAAADALLASLNNEQVGQIQLAFEGQGREEWHFVPGNNFEQTYGYPRRGLTYINMQSEQRHLADALLSTGLSKSGFLKAKTIMSLEDVLRIKEADRTGRRNPLKYHFTVYGKPSADGAWGYRVEGHHLSLHYTLKGGKLVSTTPTFFGANPHEVDISPRTGLRPLGAEEDLGRDLMKSLSPAMQKKALVADEAYRDILTAASTRAKLDSQPSGLAVSELSSAQYDMLLALIAEYADNLPTEIAAARMKEAKATAKDQMYFAWAGSIEPRKGDYYRIQAPTFLIEYDNTQNGANHSHTVWRDYDGDFGRDMLAEHHRRFDHSLPVAADD